MFKPPLRQGEEHSEPKEVGAIACEFEPIPLPESPKEVGIDVGLTHFATLSDGTEIDNPRFFRTEEKELAKAQRKLSKSEKKTKAYKKRKRVVARVHERIAFKRHNFIHQYSRKIIDKCDLLSPINRGSF